jgi:hypothetical protein
MMVDQVDRQFWKARPHAIAVLIAHGLGHCQ